MSQKRSAQASVTFHDVAIYFSEKEWQLLEEWQKELYRNVIKMIHGALTSLGHIIINSGVVFRIKKEKAPYLWNPCDSEGQERIKDPTSCYLSHSPDVFFRIKQEDDPNLRDFHDPEERECISDTITMTDHQIITSILSLSLKSEEEAHPMNDEDPTSFFTRDSVASPDSILELTVGEELFFRDHEDFDGIEHSKSPNTVDPVITTDSILEVKVEEDSHIRNHHDSMEKGYTNSSCTATNNGNAVENLQEEATCSICLDYFKDPVMTKCGHNFCRSCISLCWQSLDSSSFTCPQCRKRSHKPLLTPNRQLASMVKIAQELGPSACSLQQETQCEKHGEKLKLFCEDDQKAICVVCDRAREHKAHAVVPIVEAIIEYKEKLYGIIVPLKRKLEDVLILTSEEEKKPAELKTKVEVERKIIVSKFEELHRLLNEEKRIMLSNLEDRKTELHNKIRTNIIKLTEQSSSVQQLIKEVDGKLHRTNIDVLKEISRMVTAALEDRLHKLQSAVEGFYERFESHSTRLAAVEQRVSDREEAALQERTSIMALQAQVATLTGRLDNQENRQRRNNIRVVGLPELRADHELYAFFQVWLPTWLGLEPAAAGFLCERVHRLGPRTEDKNRARAAIARYLNWREKELIIQAYRRAGVLEYEGKKLLLFNDYSPHVASLRKDMAPLCTAFHRRGVRFALVYPASLRVWVSRIDVEEVPLSDHSPVVLELLFASESEERHWKFPCYLYRDLEFHKYIREQWLEYSSHNNTDDVHPITYWEASKAVLRGFIIAYLSRRRKAMDAELLTLSGELRQFRARHCKSLSAADKDRLLTVWRQIDTILTQRATRDIYFQCYKLYAWGGKTGRLLANLVRPPRTRQVILSIRDSKSTCYTQERQIQQQFVQFYESLYANRPFSDAARDAFFQGLRLPRLMDDQVEQLNTPISSDEVLLGIKKLKLTKAPGPDGFGSEYYKILSDQISPALAGAFNALSESRGLGTPNMAHVVLLPKPGKDPAQVGSYRPISLLNQDAKLFAAILARGLNAFLPLLVHEDQADFVLGRYASMNLIRALMALHSRRGLVSDAAIVGLDMEKAFDSISRQYLFWVLLKVKLLYCSSASSGDIMAASERVLQEIHADLCCPLCLDLFANPVYLDCGHNFCRTCITQHLDRVDPYFSCPICEKVFQDRKLGDSWHLKQLIERLKAIDMKSLAESEVSQCKAHKLPLLLYCEADREAVCMVCRESRRHRSHAMVPIEEAAQEYKEHLQSSLAPLKQELAEMETCKSTDEQKATLLQENLKRLEKTVSSEFEEMHQAMNTEEKILLARLKQEGDKIFKNIDANMMKLKAQISFLNTLVMKITETCEKPPAEMLKDGQAHFNRCDHGMQERPRCESALLDEKFLVFLGHYVGPNLLLKKYKEIVTLNTRTAQPHLVLSADGKTVKYGFVKQNLPDYPERFDFEPCVQGCEGFTSGRHYWEVEVGNGKHWAVGIAAESAKKKGRKRFIPQMGIWSVEHVCDYYDALTFPKSTRLSMKEQPQKVGLYLDYEQQQLSFYNAENMAHIYTFTDFFKEKVFPLFGTYDPVTPLRVCS
uniref:Uncharacterized protein LOC117360313 n=1 Tax=Geotrypetes seraphini TaxID=260995 RepID=A0A6P8QRS5_GEOSA|nr:uncharacterized protein LOC117360313 [Geotrypetes seraphini]